MQVKVMIDLYFALFATAYYQYGLISYKSAELTAVRMANGILTSSNVSGADLEEFRTELGTLASDLYSVLGISVINLLFPLN